MSAVGGDTIAAVATASGRAGVAVVRVSGPEAFAVAAKLTGRAPVAGRFFHAVFRSPSADAAVDDGLVLAFRAPHSYTGEDVVEFQGHGGAVAPRRLLAAVCAAGARLARRGEFTERAFLNGRLDYDQAESVLGLVDAKTDRAAAAALEGLLGRSRRDGRELYEAALGISTELEHALDVDETELPAEFLPGIVARIRQLRERLEATLRRAREGKVLREGALVVLAGPPNVGKSSLMNALLGESRAIVSDHPGTTRDSIEEWLELNGWPIRLVDTAGLRGTDDAVEAEGVRRAETLIAQADIVLELDDGSGARVVDRSVASTASFMAVATKADLGRPAGAKLAVSALTGAGLDELKRAIVAELEARLDRQVGGEAEMPAALRLNEVLALMPEPAQLAAMAAEPVLLGNVLRQVTERLGELVGAVYSDDLLERLFSRFCVGK